MAEQLKDIIKGCKKGKRTAQKALYDLFAPKMLSVCKRYVHDTATAEDILLQGFFKVFKHIHQHQEKGSFEGWIRRIIVNEALMYLRKKKHIFEDIDNVYKLNDQSLSALDQLQAAEILQLVAELPLGYRTIFNLYIIEGYKHREIAEQLNISINTSKSQLIQAKKQLQKKINQLNYKTSELN